MIFNRFGIKDFKAVSGEQYYDLNPITVFIGKNSSGKSSVLKSIELLAESFKQTKDFSTLQFTGGKRMLGSYDSALNNKSEDKTMKFVLPLDLRFTETTFYLHLFYRKGKNNMGEDGELCEASIMSEDGLILFIALTNIHSFSSYAESINELRRRFGAEPYKHTKDDAERWDLGKSDLVCYYNIEYFRNLLDREIEEYMRNSPKKIPGIPSDNDLHTDYLYEDIRKSNNAFENITSQKIRYIWEDKLYQFGNNPELLLFYEGIVINKYENETKADYSKELPKQQTNAISNDPVKAFPSILGSTSKQGIQDVFKHKNANGYFQYIILEKEIEELYGYDHVEAELSPKGEFVLNEMYMLNISNAIDDVIRNFEGFKYLTPFRGITERVYLSGMSRSHFSDFLNGFIQSDISKHEGEFLDTWLRKFGIGDKLILKRHEGFATSVFIEKHGKNVLLADLGYGYQQLLPIILQIVLNVRQNHDFMPDQIKPTTILIEEPESNLHPNMQSMLADLFVEASLKFNIRFIVETHSEYLIRKLQYLTVHGEIKPEDTSIYYFDSGDKTNGNPSYKIEIMNDGSLSKDFGTGFFDEADNLAIDLFNFKSNKN